MDHAIAKSFDRAVEDVGNIVEFGHVNVLVPDQDLATIFYVSGLGLTRDPFLMTGVDNMWVNAGTAQFHLPSGPAQVLGGVVGLVLPDLDGLRDRLARVRLRLAGTQYSEAAMEDGLEVTSPWGNRVRCHAPGPRWPGIGLGMVYVELDTPPGTAPGIARFYRDVLRATATARPGAADVSMGTGFTLTFMETASAAREWDGNHVQITLADFSTPHAWLSSRGLISEESDQHQYRFQHVVDVETSRPLVTVEHEVRSMRHPLYARPLLNRDPARSTRDFLPGRESMAWARPPS